MLTRRSLLPHLLAFTIVSGAAEVAHSDPLSSWSDVINSANRFEVVLFGKAALDKETGLVWELEPFVSTGASEDAAWSASVNRCYLRTVGGIIGRTQVRRGGWRLPTIEEMTTLITPGRGLPPEHPFVGAILTPQLNPIFWTITSAPQGPLFAYTITKDGQLSLHDKAPGLVARSTWCVRGGHGHDPVH